MYVTSDYVYRGGRDKVIHQYINYVVIAILLFDTINGSYNSLLQRFTGDGFEMECCST